jgi:hypothetical protein
VTSASATYVIEEAPTSTTIVYAHREDAPFKIATVGDPVTGQFLGSPNPATVPATPYTFGSAGNDFVLRNFNILGDKGGTLKDVTLDTVVVYNQPKDGQISPSDRSGNGVVTCRLASDSSVQQQTCPLTCETSPDRLPGAANWDCGGTWYTHDTGSCTNFQAYLVSQ